MRYLSASIILLALAGCGTGDGSSAGYENTCVQQTSGPCIQEYQPTVASFGDSHSIGYAAPTRAALYESADYRHDSWEAEDIEPEPDHPADFDAKVTTAAINDGNSTQLVQWMERDLNDRFYTVIIYNAGNHDIHITKKSHGLPETSLATYRFNLEAAAGIAQQHASAVIWVDSLPIPPGSLGPDVMPSEIDQRNEIADEVANEHGFYILHLNSKYQIPNNVHYTAQGYDYLGSQVADCVMAVLSGTDTTTCHR